MPVYDDNFGHWTDTDDPDMMEFYERVQSTNVEKQCQGCRNTVRIQPNYAYCNSCADRRERGMDF